MDDDVLVVGDDPLQVELRAGDPGGGDEVDVGVPAGRVGRVVLDEVLVQQGPQDLDVPGRELLEAAEHQLFVAFGESHDRDHGSRRRPVSMTSLRKGG